MDLFFALRGGQIGRSVMWSNGAILPILGIICILSIAGVILIYSYSAAFEAFRKSLREKTARYLAIFLVLMELCGMTYVDLYHTHLLGGLGKTAAKLNRHGSYDPWAAQSAQFPNIRQVNIPYISKLRIDDPIYKMYEKLDRFDPNFDSPSDFLEKIDEFLVKPGLTPEVKAELIATREWLRPIRDKRLKQWQEIEDRYREQIKNPADPASAHAANELLGLGVPLSQEEIENCFRSLIRCSDYPAYALTPETLNYARKAVGDRLSQADRERLENEVRATLSAPQEAAPANPAAGALVPQNSSSTSGSQTSPVPTTGQPNTNGGSSSGTITDTPEEAGVTNGGVIPIR